MASGYKSNVVINGADMDQILADARADHAKIADLEKQIGGGGCDAFVVRFTDLQVNDYNDNGDPVYGSVAANKSFDEILAARNSGKAVFGVMSDESGEENIFNLYYVPSLTYISFLSSQTTNEGSYADPDYGIMEITVSQNKGAARWNISWSEDNYGGRHEYPLLARENVVEEISKDGSYSDKNVPSVGALINYVDENAGGGSGDSDVLCVRVKKVGTALQADKTAAEIAAAYTANKIVFAVLDPNAGVTDVMRHFELSSATASGAVFACLSHRMNASAFKITLTQAIMNVSSTGVVTISKNSATFTGAAS